MTGRNKSIDDKEEKIKEENKVDEKIHKKTKKEIKKEEKEKKRQDKHTKKEEKEFKKFKKKYDKQQAKRKLKEEKELKKENKKKKRIEKDHKKAIREDKKRTKEIQKEEKRRNKQFNKDHKSALKEDKRREKINSKQLKKDHKSVLKEDKRKGKENIVVDEKQEENAKKVIETEIVGEGNKLTKQDEKELKKQQKIEEYNEYKKEKQRQKELRKRGKSKWSTKSKVIIVLVLLVIVPTILLMYQGTQKEVTGTMGYIQFLEEVRVNKIEKIQMTSDKSKFFTAYYKEGIGLEEQKDESGEIKELTIEDNKRVEKVINPQTDDFILTMLTNGVEIEYLESTMVVMIITVMLTLLPTLFIFGLLGFYMYKVFGNQLGNGGGKGEVTAKKHPVEFDDVAGMTEEKEELLFALKSLTDNTFKKMGVKPVRGVLLEGPPGVGKTMLAKAVANEAGVNFLSYSGSDFVEMYVGMGASRIRSMYQRAEELEPCIVFIDEIDALGRRRTTGGDGGVQESDQTLIALLEKMDGMNTEKKIMFIGATNRADMLDNALIRPGRFDKIMHIGPPKTKEDREEVVAVHLKGKTLAEEVTIEEIAKHCYGLTGAEIASILNDSVIESIRGGREGVISLEDVDNAAMKLLVKGVAKGRHLADDAERVAVHEIGHAIMNRVVGRKVVKVSIQPYAHVGGVTMVDGESEGITGLRKASDIRNDIKVLYAGKVAEEVMLGECSIGSSNDLERATQLLREYVGAYGMKEGTILSLVGLAKENMMITANEKLLESMEQVGQEIYKEVEEVFSRENIKAYIREITPELIEKEVIYSFDIEIETQED